MASGRKGLSICETPAPLRARTIEPIFSGDDDDFESRMCQHSFGSPSPPPKSDNNNNNNNKNCSTKRHGNSKRNNKLCSPNDKLYKLHRRKRSQSMDASQVDEQATKILQTLALQHDSNSNNSKNNRDRNRKTNRNDGNSIDKSDIDLPSTKTESISTWNKSKRASKGQSTCKNKSKSKSKSVNKTAKTHKNTNSLSCMTKRNSNLLAQLNMMNDCDEDDEDDDGEYENTGRHGSPLTRPVSVTVSPASVSFNASYNYNHNYNKHSRERQRPGTARSRSSNRNGKGNGNRSRHRGYDYNCSSINMKKYGGGNVNPRRSMHSIQLELTKNNRKIKELENSLAGAQLRIKSLRNDKKKLTKQIGDLCGIQAKIDAKMTRKSIEYHKMEQELRLKNRSQLYQINRRMTMLQHEKDSLKLRKESLPSLKQIDKDKKKDNNKTRKCNRHSHSKTISGMEDNYNMKKESESKRNSNNNCSVARGRRSGGHKRGYQESGSVVDIGRLREHSSAASINTNVNWKHCAASSFISNTSTASHVSNVSGSIVSKLEEYDSSSQSSVGDGFVDDVDDDDDTMSTISTLSLPGHIIYSGEYGLKEEEESNDDICGGVNVNNDNNEERNTSLGDEFGNLILNMNNETKDEILQKMVALVAENNRQRATIEQLKSMTNNGIETAKQESQQTQQQTRGIEKYSDCGAPVVVPRISILQGQLLKTESLLANLDKKNLELKNKIALKDKEISMLKEKTKLEEQEKDKEKEKDKERYQQQNQEQEVEEIKALKESNNGENGEVYINMKMNINKNDILGNDRNKEDKMNELIVDTALKMLIMSDDQHESEQTDVSSTTNMKTNNGNDGDEPGKAGGDTPWETISLQSDIEQTATLTKNDTTNAINMKQNMFTVSNTTDNGGDVSNGSKDDRWHLEQNNKNKIRHKNKGKNKDKDTGGGIKKETKMKQREGSCDHRKRTHSLVNRIQNTYSGVPFGGGCLSFCDSSMCYVYNCQDDDISDDENLETDTDIAGSSSSSCSSVENYQGYDSYED